MGIPLLLVMPSSVLLWITAQESESPEVRWEALMEVPHCCCVRFQFQKEQKVLCKKERTSRTAFVCAPVIVSVDLELLSSDRNRIEPEGEKNVALQYGLNSIQGYTVKIKINLSLL